MIIDFHTHCFPDALAPRALDALSANAEKFGFAPLTKATLADNEAHLRAAGISQFVVCNIATNARQERKVNDFAIALAGLGEHIHPLGSLHPDSENAEEELCRLAATGIKGIKLHPDYVGVALDDPRFLRLFELCAKRGLFVVIHAGFDPVSPDRIHAAPDRILSVVRRFPELRLIAAHMGGAMMAREVAEMLVGSPVYLDTSLSASRPEEKELLYDILRRHDGTRLLFGSDTPWSRVSEEIAFVKNAPLTEERKAAILSGNARRLLSLE